MLLREAIVVPVTRKLEFPPERPVLYHSQRVAAREHEKLRSDPEFLEGDLGHHRESAPRGVAPPERALLGEDLDEALVPDPDAEQGGLRVRVGPIEGRGRDNGAVDVVKGVEGDAVLGEDGEEGVGRVIDESSGEEAARGGDERGGGTVGALGWDKPALKNALGAGDVGGGICVDVDVVEAGVAFKKAVPKGSEVEVGVGEEEKGDFELWVGGGEVGECGGVGERDSAVEERDVVELVGEGDGEGGVAGRKKSRGKEEEDWEGEEEGEGEHEWGREHRERERHAQDASQGCECKGERRSVGMGVWNCE